MARKRRIWYPGASYHITSRGNRRGAIFYDDRDRLTYLNLLEETRTRYPFHLHAYCLMTNHIHLQVETIDDHPQHMMKMLHSLYAIYFNKRHRLVGHVFQGRYGAQLIDTNNYAVEVSKYIHLNPVEAKMVSQPAEYRWSSYNAYVSDNENKHVTTDKILTFFPDSQKEHYRHYVESMEETQFNLNGEH